MPEFLIHADWLLKVSEIWWDAKQWLSASSGLAHDHLHIIAGLILYPALCLWLDALHHPHPRRDAFSLLFALELANEALDLALDVWPEWQRQLLGGVEDILFTMALPTVILILVRLGEARRDVTK